MLSSPIVRGRGYGSYEYEEDDIKFILNARLREFQGYFNDYAIYAMDPIDILNDHLKISLEEEKRLVESDERPDQRFVLIPCNIGNYHWVGLLFQFNKDNQCIRAEFINSTDSVAPETLTQQLREIYHDMTFTIPTDRITQNYGTSCGACTVENLVLRMKTERISEAVDMTEIRARHLDYLNNAIYEPDISEDVRINRQVFFDKFKERQRLNRHTYNSSQPIINTPEITQILRISHLVLAIDEEIRKEIMAVLALSSEPNMLAKLQEKLWENRQNENVQKLSICIFGVNQTAAMPLEEYCKQSKLLIEYEYLKKIYSFAIFLELKIEKITIARLGWHLVFLICVVASFIFAGLNIHNNCKTETMSMEQGLTSSSSSDSNGTFFWLSFAFGLIASLWEEGHTFKKIDDINVYTQKTRHVFGLIPYNPKADNSTLQNEINNIAPATRKWWLLPEWLYVTVVFGLISGYASLVLKLTENSIATSILAATTPVVLLIMNYIADKIEDANLNNIRIAGQDLRDYSNNGYGLIRWTNPEIHQMTRVHSAIVVGPVP